MRRWRVPVSNFVNSADLIPAIKTPVENLYLATTAQIYPALTNCESISRHARQTAQVILTGVPTSGSEPERVVGLMTINDVT